MRFGNRSLVCAGLSPWLAVSFVDSRVDRSVDGPEAVSIYWVLNRIRQVVFDGSNRLNFMASAEIRCSSSRSSASDPVGHRTPYRLPRAAWIVAGIAVRVAATRVTIHVVPRMV